MLGCINNMRLTDISINVLGCVGRARHAAAGGESEVPLCRRSPTTMLVAIVITTIANTYYYHYYHYHHDWILLL